MKAGDLRISIGGLIYVNILGQDTLIIGSFDVASDLLEKRSNIYSDRPVLTLDEMCVLLKIGCFSPLMCDHPGRVLYGHLLCSATGLDGAAYASVSTKRSISI